ncbi:DUF1353 domain-containing protein [Pseudomonas sp. ODNR1LW]|nr:DUF1353 domain-containing protein [Pseudomonas sp. ODNR1LW]
MPSPRKAEPSARRSNNPGSVGLPRRPKSERSGRFSGKLYLVLLDNRDRPSTRGGRSLWALQQELEYRPGDGDEELIVIPRGFVTDLTSIPRLVWSVYPPDGPWAKAAVIHDFLYYTKGTGVWHRHCGVTRAQAYTRKEADDILKQAMADRKIGAWEQFVIWSAVRLGGASGWGK